MPNHKVSVRFLAAAVSALGSFKKGDEAELRREDAQPLLDAGVVEKITAENVAKPAKGSGQGRG